MNLSELVNSFYHRIWNAGDLSAVPDLLSPGFEFRGSLGLEMCGHESFKEYVRSVRSSLSNYNCEILESVIEGNLAFVKMRFSGLHTGVFRGYSPTGRPVQWLGTALFHSEDGVISSLWVLGDLVGLDCLLQQNSVAQSGPHQAIYQK